MYDGRNSRLIELDNKVMQCRHKFPYSTEPPLSSLTSVLERK